MRAQGRKIIKKKGMLNATTTIGTQATGGAPPNDSGVSIDVGEPLRPQRNLRTHGPVNPNPPLDPEIETDNDKYLSDHESDTDEETPFRGHTPIRKDKGNRKGNGKGSRYCLNPKDPANFLKLVSALNILLSDTLTDKEIDTADDLVREYNIELIEVGRTPGGLPLLNFICLALWTRCNKAK